MEQILSKVKQKAWLFAGSAKSSLSMSGGLPNVDMDMDKMALLDATKLDSSSRKNKLLSRSSNPEFLEMIQSEIGGAITSHTINEAKLAKLHSILNVLREARQDTRDSGGADSDAAEQSGRPEFLSIFDAGSSDIKEGKSSGKGESGRYKKRKKRSKLAKAVLRVLREDSADVSSASDSGDNLDDGPPVSALNKQSMAWLRARKLDPNYGSGHRPRSDSFQTIPRLRESLNAGRVNKVSTYCFDDRSADKLRLQSNLPHNNNSAGLAHMARGEESRASKDVAPSQTQLTPRDNMQLHYRVMDTKSLIEEDSPSYQDSKFSSPVCKHYSVPVEVSLHRISVKDVDKPLETEIARTKSFGVAYRHNKTDASTGDDSHFQPESGSLMLTKPRSRSLGDILNDPKSEDEVLIVRTPVKNRTPNNSPMSQRRPVAVVDVGVQPELGEEELSSLDFVVRTSGGVAAMRHAHSRSLVGSGDGDGRSASIADQPSWEGEGGGGNLGSNLGATLTKSRSLNNLVEAVPKGKKK